MPLFEVTKKYIQYDYIAIEANTKEEAEYVALNTYKFDCDKAVTFGDTDLDTINVEQVTETYNFGSAYYVDATNFDADEYPVKEL